MAGAWARKKSQEVPIQGTIVNDETMESETDKTLTINAIKRLTHGSNILSNGDFQINQRGLSSYQSSGYTLDMWKAYKVNVTIIENGLSVNRNTTSENGFFTQIVENISQSKQYTICTKVFDEIYIWTFTPTITSQRKNFTNFNLFFKLTDSKLEVGFELNTNTILNIEYIDLFDGTIAYPHAKEDYSIALLRCMRFVQLLNYSISHNAVSNSFANYSTVFLPMPMANIPTIAYKQQSESTNVSTLTEEYSSGNINVQIVAKMSGAVRIINRTILLSCEPL